MRTLVWALSAWLAAVVVPLGLAAKASAQPSSGDQAAIRLWNFQSDATAWQPRGKAVHVERAVTH